MTTPDTIARDAAHGKASRCQTCPAAATAPLAKGRRGVLTTAVIGLCALALAACQPVARSARGPAVTPGAPIQVALLVPGGSSSAGDDLVARNLENAARMAASDLGGTVQLRVYNTAANPSQAAAVAGQAVAEGAQIIVGPLHAQDANAAGHAVAASGINVLSFSNNAEIAGGNVFILGQTFQNTAGRLLRHAASQGRRNVVIVHDPDTAGQIGRRAIEEAAAASGMSVVGVESYELSQQGVVAAVPQIARTVQATGADVVFFTASTTGALPMLTQLLRENGVDPNVSIFMGLTRWDAPPGAVTSPALQGGYFARPDPGVTQQFESRYAAAYGQPPHALAALAYDGVAAVGALAKSRRPDALSARRLTQSAGFAGANGIFRLFPNGTNERALAVAQIRDNQVQVIENAPKSFSGAGF